MYKQCNSVLKKVSYLKKREKNVYQKHKLSHLGQHKKIYSDKYKKYCSAVCACIQSVLAWSDLQWFQDVTVLAIQGWQKLVDEEETLVAEVENLLPRCEMLANQV